MYISRELLTDKKEKKKILPRTDYVELNYYHNNATL